MRARRSEAGFTLIELIVVVAIVVLVAAAAGAFFLGGASPAVASAGRDISAAFAEARQTAIADDEATVVFAPALTGSGYRARVYARAPGDPGFAPRNGPEYDSTAAIGETSAPLGAPGFAFVLDGRGGVTGYAGFSASAGAFDVRPCPASGAFTLHVADAHQSRDVAVPCAVAASSVTPASFATAPAAATPAPYASAGCPPGAACSLAALPAAPAPVCPAGTVADPLAAGVCDAAGPPAPAPVPTAAATPPGSAATCPPGTSGAFPACSLAGPPPAPSPPAARCAAGPADALGFATCIVADPVIVTGPGIRHVSCGARVPVTDPGPSFSVAVDVFQNGVVWGTYSVRLRTLKTAWLDPDDVPPAATCGLNYTLSFSIDAVVALGGNASVSPSADTGDPALVDEGVGAIVAPADGAVWGSDS